MNAKKNVTALAVVKRVVREAMAVMEGLVRVVQVVSPMQTRRAPFPVVSGMVLNLETSVAEDIMALVAGVAASVGIPIVVT